MAKPYLHVSKDAANLWVGGTAATALLFGAWLGQALAHTAPTADGLWRNVKSEHGADGALKAAANADKAQAALGLAGPVSPEPPPQTFRQLSPQDAAAANANVPFSALPNPPAAPFKLDAADTNDRARALDCLTMAVYYEAASEPDQGQAAVAQVVLNRLRHPLFPKTVCGVVLQGASLPTGCQFTFTCDGSLGRKPSDAGWKHARHIAERALDGYVQKSVGEATHYHTLWVVPYWQPTVVKLTQIGAHIFYRWAGDSGRPVAFHGRYAGAEQPPPHIDSFTDGVTVAATPIKVLTPDPPVEAPAAVAVAVAAPVKVATLNASATQLAEAQAAAAKPQGYFGRPDAQSQHLPMGSGW